MSTLFNLTTTEKVKGFFGSKKPTFKKNINESTGLIKENIVKQYLMSDFKKAVHLFNKDLSEIQVRIFKDDKKLPPIISQLHTYEFGEYTFSYRYTLTSTIENDIVKHTFKVHTMYNAQKEASIEHNKYYDNDTETWLSNEDKTLTYDTFDESHSIELLALLITLAIYSYLITHNVSPEFNIKAKNTLTTINKCTIQMDAMQHIHRTIESTNMSIGEFITTNIIKKIYNQHLYFNQLDYGSLCAILDGTYSYIKQTATTCSIYENYTNPIYEQYNYLIPLNNDYEYNYTFHNLIGSVYNNIFAAINEIGDVKLICRYDIDIPFISTKIIPNAYYYDSTIKRDIAFFTKSKYLIIVSDKNIYLILYGVIDLLCIKKGKIALPSNSWTVVKCGVSCNDEYIGIVYYENDKILNLYILNFKTKKTIYYKDIINFMWLPKTPNELIIQYKSGFIKKENIITKKTTIIAMPPLNRRNSPKKLLLTNLCISNDEKYIGLIFERNKINIYSLLNKPMVQAVFHYSTVKSITIANDVLYIIDIRNHLNTIRIDTIPIPE